MNRRQFFQAIPLCLPVVKASEHAEFQDLPTHTIVVTLNVGAASDEVAAGAVRGPMQDLVDRPLYLSPREEGSPNRPAVITSVVSVVARSTP